jgi:nucleotide-binding universal stress UspA family protein
MKPKILVALDGSEVSKRAVEYVASLTSGLKEAEITLYHVAEVPAVFLEHGGGELHGNENLAAKAGEGTLGAWIEQERQRTEREIFGPAKKIFEARGGGAGPTVRAQLENDIQLGVPRTIMNEVKEGGYDTLVLGRRGRSMLKEFMFGGVTSKVIHHIKDCAIWIIE